jgi:hypothetical protein
MQNHTDYDFPDSWGLYTDDMKHDWFVRERTLRQAGRQQTYFGRRYRNYEQRKSDYRIK